MLCFIRLAVIGDYSRRQSRGRFENSGQHKIHHRPRRATVLMGINPFDQFGVELGKQMAKAIEQGGEAFDASTEALVKAAGLA